MATTPELYEPHIAAARARAWHQATSQATAQTEAETEPEAQAEAEPEAKAQADPEAQAEAEPETEAAVESEAQTENTSEAQAEAGPQVRAGDEGTSSSPAQSRILTLEAARDFVNRYGLVLFGPRSLGAPAPSLVEATLGAAKSTVTPAEAEIARSLVGRLVAEGSALPLNLLGGPGDVPDFIVSTAAFPFVFTLRGDKGWKRAPETSGAVKVTTLALHVFEVLTEKGALTVAEIVHEVGREINDSAVTRALSELWAMLRVIPSASGSGGTTRWELTSARFLKAVKAGANAGQPTALSALISLYLGQVYLATEDEICAFLSPLTARSRVRDVLHGLSAGQQLSEAVLEGKTVLFLPDSLPNFAPGADLEENSAPSIQFREQLGPASDGRENASSGEASGEGAVERIRRFDGGGTEAGRDRSFRGKPSPRPGGFRSGPPRANPRSGDASERAPRPASRGPHADRPQQAFEERRARPSAGAPSREGGSDRSSFSRPWDEEKRERPARPDGDRPFRPTRPAFGAQDSRPPRREDGSNRPPFGKSERGDRGDRPSFRREGTGGAPPFRSREGGAGGRPFRSSFSPEGGAQGDRKPGADARPPRRESGSGGFFPRRDNRDGGSDRSRPFRPAGGRSFGSSGASDSSAPRKSFDPSDRGRTDASRSFGGGFRPRDDRGGGPPRSSDRGPGGRPPFRRDEGGGGGRSFGDRPDRPQRPFGDRPPSSFGDRPARPSGPRPSRPFGDRPARDGEGTRSRPAGSFGERGGSRPSGFADRPSRGPGGAAGGFKRAPGGFSRGPGGPSRGPGGGSSRAPRRGAESDRPPTRPRPEDGA